MVSTQNAAAKANRDPDNVGLPPLPPPLGPKPPSPVPMPEMAPMMKWFSPKQLSADAANILLSYALGDRNDFRLLEAVVAVDDKLEKEREEAEQKLADADEVWLDYVADVADGWNPTYAIASLLASELSYSGKAEQLQRGAALAVGEAGPNDTKLPRGDVLIMGGDEVYPSATRRNYDVKLVVPYMEACGFDSSRRHTDPQEPRGTRSLYAIPGNHDWYDGLTSFTRLFSQGRTIADWTSRQSRSYFAVKLPGKWWLFAVDIHLTADIDRPQLEYFKRMITEHVRPGDEVILVAAEPEWLKIRADDDPNRTALHQNLGYFEESMVQHANKEHGAKRAAGDTNDVMRFRVRIAGDYHHYQRHSRAKDPKHCIVAGGGGAFLHPTHDDVMGAEVVRLGRTKKPSDYTRVEAFPTVAESKQLLASELWYGARFPFLNWSSLLFAFPLYGALTAFMRAGWTFSLGALAAFLAFLVAVAPSTQPQEKVKFGAVHFGIHLIALLGIHAIWLRLGGVALEKKWEPFIPVIDYTPTIPWGALLVMVSTTLIGGLLGGMAFGAYLVYMNTKHSKHGNEVFAAFRSQDFKNFLRIRVRKDSLTIFAIGLRTCPTEWRANPAWQNDTTAVPRWIPAQGSLSPTIIDRIDVGGAG